MGVFNFLFKIGKGGRVIESEIIAPNAIRKVNIEGVLGLHKKNSTGQFLHPFETIDDKTVYRLEGGINVTTWEDDKMKSHIRIDVDGREPIPETVLEIIRREQKDNDRPPLLER